MKEVLATLSLASLLCSQVSMTLYSQSPSDSSDPASPGSENMTAVQGESVIFRLVGVLTRPSLLLVSRCNMETEPGQQIVWRKGTEVLSAGPTLLKLDPRYSVTAQTAALTITSLAKEDSGEFVCQVQTELGLRETKHLLAIQGLLTL